MVRLVRGEKFNSLVGDSLNELVKEAMTYVTRNNDFWYNSIKGDLAKASMSVISIHTCPFRNAGITIYYDPTGKLSDEDLALPQRELKKKYPEFHF